MKKGGLSGVVTVILIILLVLVAIGIIWAAIRPPIEETGERISGDCLTLDVEALSCAPATGDEYEVRFMRNPGAGTVNSVKMVFYNVDDETRIVDYNLPLTELETVRETSTLTGFVPVRFNVAAVISPGETPITCEITNQPVDC